MKRQLTFKNFMALQRAEIEKDYRTNEASFDSYETFTMAWVINHASEFRTKVEKLFVIVQD